MGDSLDIDYKKIISRHMLGVVSDVLKMTQEHGLIGNNYFYITFKTNYPGVVVPDVLKANYPQEVTIVLQHQFSELKVFDDSFSVVLVFSGVPHKLTIPFGSLIYFADPHEKIGFSFNEPDEDAEDETEDDSLPEIKEDSEPRVAEVISIDRFRKK